MIGGARSAKSPRDQAYIYFRVLRRARGGWLCQGRKDKGREERGGREDRGPRNNAAYGACSSGLTRDAVQRSAAGCIINRFSHEAAAHRALPGCPFPPFALVSLLPFSCVPRIVAPLRSKMLPLPSRISSSLCFFFSFICFIALSFPPAFCSAVRITRHGFSGIKLCRRES